MRMHIYMCVCVSITLCIHIYIPNKHTNTKRFAPIENGYPIYIYIQETSATTYSFREKFIPKKKKTQKRFFSYLFLFYCCIYPPGIFTKITNCCKMFFQSNIITIELLLSKIYKIIKPFIILQIVFPCSHFKKLRKYN